MKWTYWHLRLQISHDPCSYECNFCDCIWKPEKFRTSTGFEPPDLTILRYWLDHDTTLILLSSYRVAIGVCIARCLHVSLSHHLCNGPFAAEQITWYKIATLWSKWWTRTSWTKPPCLNFLCSTCPSASFALQFGNFVPPDHSAGCWLFAGLVPLHRVAITSLPALIVFLHGPHQPLMTPVPMLIYSQRCIQVFK